MGILSRPQAVDDAPAIPSGARVTPSSDGVLRQPEDRPIIVAHKKDALELGVLPILTSATPLNVKNNGDKTITIKWDRDTWILEPGESTLVTFAAVVNVLGDPRSIEGNAKAFVDRKGNRGLIPPRANELDRLFARYGVMNGNLHTESERARLVAGTAKNNIPAPDGPVSLTGRAPTLEVTTHSGHIIAFPAKDPRMAPYPSPDEPQTGKMRNSLKENDAMKERLDRQESEIAKLKEILNIRGESLDASSTSQ